MSPRPPGLFLNSVWQDELWGVTWGLVDTLCVNIAIMHRVKHSETASLPHDEQIWVYENKGIVILHMKKIP